LLLFTWLNFLTVLSGALHGEEYGIALRMALGAGVKHLAGRTAALAALPSACVGLGAAAMMILLAWVSKLFSLPPSQPGMLISPNIPSARTFLAAAVASTVVATAAIAVAVWIRLTRVSALSLIKTPNGPSSRSLLPLMRWGLTAQAAVAIMSLALAAVTVTAAIKVPRPEFRLQADRVGVIFVEPSLHGLKEAQDTSLINSMFSVLSSRFGHDAAVSSQLPFGVFGESPARARVSTSQGAQSNRNAIGLKLGVSADFFRVMGIPMLMGSAADLADARSVVLSKSLAKVLFGDTQDARNREVLIEAGQLSQKARVAGVAEDVTRDSSQNWSDTRLIVYCPISVCFGSSAFLLLRDEDVTKATSAASNDLRTAFPGIVPSTSNSLDELISYAHTPYDLGVMVSVFLASVVVAVTIVGYIGFYRFLALSSRRDFAIRTALGATYGAMCIALLRPSLTPTVLGCVMGIGTVYYVSTRLPPAVYSGLMLWPVVIVASVALTLIICVSAITQQRSVLSPVCKHPAGSLR
jgi:hypothetical protein